MASTDRLTTQLDRLAAFDGGPFPVVSLYLNLQPDQHGRDSFEPFVRKELPERIQTYGAGPERDSLEKDAAKIMEYLADVDPAINGLALFSCSGADFFEAIPLAAPIDRHWLIIADVPHLYPLARVLDGYPRFVVLLADTSYARIFVVAANAIEQSREVEGVKTKRHKMGGWSQARYQRHVDEYHARHAKEVVDALTRIVRDEQIDSVVVAGDEVIVPLLRDQFPKDVAERVVDTLRLDIRAPEREILETTVALMRAKDAQTDRERVESLLGAYRAGGLAVVGLEPTKRALEMGQVDELLLTARAGQGGQPGGLDEQIAGELIAKARQTGASFTFIEDPALLAPFGGVGAFLRFRL